MCGCITEELIPARELFEAESISQYPTYTSMLSGERKPGIAGTKTWFFMIYLHTKPQLLGRPEANHSNRDQMRDWLNTAAA